MLSVLKATLEGDAINQWLEAVGRCDDAKLKVQCDRICRYFTIEA
jgi:hypothetical protein